MGFWKRLGKAIIAEPTIKDIEDMREELSPENSKYLSELLRAKAHSVVKV